MQTCTPAGKGIGQREEKHFSAFCFFCKVNRIAGGGARESTRQQRRHTSTRVCADVACSCCSLVALAAQEGSGLQVSGHIASRSPAFAPHLALCPAVRQTLSSHPPTTTLSVSRRQGFCSAQDQLDGNNIIITADFFLPATAQKSCFATSCPVWL